MAESLAPSKVIRGYFVTGFPGFVARHLARRLSEKGPVTLLAQEHFAEEATKFAATLGTKARVLVGDVVDMHLGLSSPEYRQICAEVTDIYHAAGITYLGTDKQTTWRVNVDGTKNMLELAADVKQLARFNHFSTVYVSGDRVGVIMEDELAAEQKFRNAFEGTKFEAEILVRRAMARLPVTVYRPSIIVGDSRTGEIDRFEGPYLVAMLLVASPLAVPLPLPGNGAAPLNAVPIDFAVNACVHIGHDPRGVGKTFHLVDPNPIAARRVYELIAARIGKRLPKLSVSFKLADALLKLPLVEPLARNQRVAFAYVNHLALYNSRNTHELLDGTGIACPPIEAYLDNLIAYARATYARVHGTEKKRA